MGENFQKSVWFAQWERPHTPVPCIAILWKHICSPAPLLSSCCGWDHSSLLAGSSWPGFSHHTPAQGPFRSLAWQFSPLLQCLRSCGAWRNPDTIATPSLASSSWTAGLQGCPRGQTPASPRFPTYPQKEVEQQGHRVRKAAGLSLGDMGFSIAQETLGKGIWGLWAIREQEWIWCKECWDCYNICVLSLPPQWLPSPHSPQQ